MKASKKLFQQSLVPVLKMRRQNIFTGFIYWKSKIICLTIKKCDIGLLSFIDEYLFLSIDIQAFTAHSMYVKKLLLHQMRSPNSTKFLFCDIDHISSRLDIYFIIFYKTHYCEKSVPMSLLNGIEHGHARQGY